ncbi:MAG: hypothetical protein IJT25_03520 [Clostridia bacterium]|nr:hypothetical protein [Clostridia bacterium]
MKILVINCAYKTRLMAIAGDKIKTIDADPAEKNNDALLEKIEKLLNSLKLKLKDLDAVAICIGPGSFTGLRASLSLLKGIFKAYKINLITFTSFDEFEYNANDYVVIEGFSNFVYTCFNGRIECKEIAEAESEALKCNGKIIFQTEALKNNFNCTGIIGAKRTAELIKEKFEKNSFDDIEMVEPLYARLSQAEIEREKKINGENKKSN